MNAQKLKTAFKKYFTPVYVVIIAVFMCWFFYKNQDSIWAYLQNFKWRWLILAAFCQAGFYAFQCLAFIQIQSQNAGVKPRAITFTSWFFAYMYGLMGHYIPGKISVVLGRIMALAPLGVKKEAAILCVFYETMVATAISFAISIPLVFIVNAGKEALGLSQIICGMLIFAILTALVFTPLFKNCVFLVLRLFKTSLSNAAVFLTFKIMLKIVGRYLVSYILLMLAFYFFCKSVAPLDFSVKTIYITGGGMVFSGALGVIALFAPSGLGVREAGIVYFIAVAANLIPLEVALLIAVCYRLLTAVIEIILFGLAVALKKSTRKLTCK